MSTDNCYIPKLDRAPTVNDLTLALAARGGDLIAQPSERIRCMARMSLAEMAAEAAFWQYGATQASYEESLRGEFDLSSGMMASAFDNFFGTTVLNSYAQSPDKSDDLLMEVDVKNYLPARIIVAVDNMHLSVRGNGRADLQSLTAYAYAWRAFEYARAILIDEKDLINDSFGVIRTCAQALGRAPRRAKEDLLFAMILENPVLPTDSEKLFSEAHNNILSGPSSELGSESLASAIQKIREQVFIDPDGYVVHCELEPRYLVVPPALETRARQYLRLQKLDNLKTDIELRVTSRLSNLGVVNPISGVVWQGSSTNWALFTSAKSSPCFAIGYLEGNRRPAIRTAQLGGAGGVGGRWGLSFDIHQGFAMCPVDYRGGVFSVGA
jgi:hypothetical protein